MTRLSYDTAETVIFDPIAANRTATRTALYNLGFRRIEAVASLEALAESIRRRPPDLALCDAHGALDDLCGMVQGLRQGANSYNPFIVIIVTAWEQSQTLVSRVLNSGADDLLLRPFSTSNLGQRIATHILHRKGFVITSEYVGPDRRRTTERPSNAELFQPPNSLRMKAKDRLTSEEAAHRLDQELKSARDILTREKLRRDAFQICVLWRLMQAHALKVDKFQIDLSKLKNVTKGVARRCVGTEFEPAVDWCDSVLGALEGLELGVDRNASMHLLGHAALNLNQLFAPEKSQTDHLTAIDATVAIVRARMQTADAGVQAAAG
ncbi:MAG: response regulator [Rhizomicrobium sp.]|jgi:DNA-binding response OmpR family regulator